MKIRLITFLFPLVLAACVVRNESGREVGFSDVGLDLSFVGQSVGSGPDRILVTLTNAGLRDADFRLPSPFVAEDPDGYAPYPPYLALVVKERKTGKEEEFVLTSLRKPAGPAKLAFLKAGQGTNIEYPLMLFYRWGPCSPKDGNFKECFKPGDGELEVRAEVFVLEKSGPRRILSPPQPLRSSFPEWLFKETSAGGADPAAPKRNRGGDTKPQGNPRKTD